MTKALLGMRTNRQRIRMACLAFCALLLQQIALLAYACPAVFPAPASETPMVGCEDMQMPDPEAPVLCQQHCQRDQLTSPDLKSPQVPPLALPPPHFALTEALLPPVRSQHYKDVPLYRSDPPPAQRFCSLQI